MRWYMCLLGKNESAVSAVIGVVLMVAVTVMVAAVVAVFGFGFTGDFGGANPKRPVSAITVVNIPETTGIVDMKITYRGGDTLKAGQWKLSIVPVGQPPVYKDSSTDFRPGDMIITTSLTSGTGTYTVTNSSVTSDGIPGTLTADGKYDVKIVVYPFKSMALDTVVEVR
jgi:FlaG/FlaF family flagellin (archaellin)